MSSSTITDIMNNNDKSSKRATPLLTKDMHKRRTGVNDDSPTNEILYQGDSKQDRTRMSHNVHPVLSD